MENFKKLGLTEDILKIIESRKFTNPTEIQEKAIPLSLEGKDIIAGSATGSGKTLAFGSSLIMKAEKGKGIQALVLVPTRELAEQVAQELLDFSYHKKLEIAAVYGGVSMVNQVKKLPYAEIVVATPGRLLDHIRQNSVNLNNVQILVLDEADRMWDMGFKEDVSDIVKRCPKNRQTMLFSATIGHELAEFSNKYMKSPIEVSVQNKVDPTKLKQIYYDVRDDEKFSLLVHLLKNESSHLVMIFSNTRRNADMVAKNLQLNGIDAQVIHGGMEQNKRNRVLKNFDNSNVNVLVCTDVAARGLDIDGVSHVYNYDIPTDPRDYIHRIGRTARAGKDGIAINLIASRDYDSFSIVQRNNRDLHIERVMTPKFEHVFVKIDRSRGKFNRGGRGSFNRGGGGGRFGRGRSGGNFGGGNRSEGGGRNSFGRDRPRSGFRGSRNTRDSRRKDFNRENRNS